MSILPWGGERKAFETRAFYSFFFFFLNEEKKRSIGSVSPSMIHIVVPKTFFVYFLFSEDGSVWSDFNWVIVELNLGITAGVVKNGFWMMHVLFSNKAISLHGIVKGEPGSVSHLALYEYVCKI